MFPTEAYLLAALVAVIGTAFTHALWRELDTLQRMAAPLLCLIMVLAVFILVSEVWWWVRLHPTGVGS